MRFPKGFNYRIEKDLFDWWGFGIKFPFVSVDKVYDLGTVFNNYGFYAGTGLMFETAEFYYKFEISFLGFGFWYARQWGY